MHLSLYCSGSIQKGSTDNKKTCWSDVERQKITDSAKPIHIAFLNPDDPVVNIDDTIALFGRDMFQIYTSDVVVIDARERRGLGIGVELLAAKHFCKPTIAIVPPNSYYRQDALTYRGGTASNYVHPHLRSLLDAYVDDFEAAGRWLRDNFDVICNGSFPVKDTILNSAVDAYKARLLPYDEPMKTVLSSYLVK